MEGLALGVFEFHAGFFGELDPGYAQVLRGVVADERRHVGFGVTRVREILDADRAGMTGLVDTLSEMSDHMTRMFVEMADTLASYGMDVDDVMGRVKSAHETHWRRLGLPVAA